MIQRRQTKATTETRKQGQKRVRVRLSESNPIQVTDRSDPRRSQGARPHDRAQSADAPILAQRTGGRRVRLGGFTRHTAFGVYAWAWLAKKEKAGLRSAIDYASTIRRHLVPRFGPRRIGDIRTPDVRAFVGELRSLQGDAALSSRRVLGIYACLRNIFRDAVAEELLDRQPCCLRGKDLPANEDADPRFRRSSLFTTEEIQALVRAPSDLFWRSLYVALFATGARVGELLGLRWRDVHLDEEPLGRIDVVEAWASKRREASPPKTRLAREVPIAPPLARALHALRDHLSPDEGDLVWGAPGAHLSSREVLEHLHADLTALGLRRRRVHDARRTFISLACNSEGADLQVLRRVTHLRPADVHSAYREIPWDVTCREFSKIKPLMGLEVSC